MNTAKLAVTAALFAALPQVAFAGTASEKISACKAEIRAQLAETAPAADVDFRKIKATSRRATISFRVTTEDAKDKIRCVAHDSKPIEITWGDDINPAPGPLVKADDKTEKAGGN